MFYTIYKITNKLNGKFYIGMHKTKDLNDGYMGSGKLIKRAILKYGVENFTKEILHSFDNEEDMKAKEKELVVISEQTYNLCDGGKGGFGYINRNLTGSDKKIEKATKIHFEKYRNDAAYRKRCQDAYRESKKDPSFGKKVSEGLKIYYSKNPNNWLGKKHTEETKQKLRKSKNVGKDNSQFGTCWITNGVENKKVKKEELDIWVNKGYYKGRMRNG